jgi:hypothetical protein
LRTHPPPAELLPTQEETPIETEEFLAHHFGAFYRSRGATIPAPPGFEEREYAFFWFSRKGALRHLAFKNPSELVAFMAKESPAHAFHSAAYYETPDASQMPLKGWLGADLVFDIDADHLKDVCKQYLALIKKKTGSSFPRDPMVQLELAIEAVFRSWMGKRAVDYRREFKITLKWPTGQPSIFAPWSLETWVFMGRREHRIISGRPKSWKSFLRTNIIHSF